MISKTTQEKKSRKPYTPPNVVNYGEVRTLTQSGSVGPAENSAAGQPEKKPGSDRRVKQNIVRIGRHPLGIGLYLFDYRPEFRDEWGHGRQFGAMADEVENVMPEAVSVHENGFMVVDYALLGIFPTRH
jgi:Chaperone of endosialidase